MPGKFGLYVFGNFGPYRVARSGGAKLRRLPPPPAQKWSFLLPSPWHVLPCRHFQAIAVVNSFFRSGILRNPRPLVFFQKYCRYKWEAYYRYKWEAYCGTNGTHTVVQTLKRELHHGICLSSKLRSQERTTIQMGGDCGTNWKCIAAFFREVVRVGGS